MVGSTKASSKLNSEYFKSRDLKSSELEAGLAGITIAMDGIAVIVNHENPADDLTSEAVKAIFVGDVFEWNEVAE